MTRRRRSMLKEQFEKGKMPTQEDFADLIDSMLSMLDEGFEKTQEAGFKIAQLRDGKLLSFYQDIGSGTPMWSLDLDKANSDLSFKDKRAHPVLTLASSVDAEGVERSAVGIRQSQPRHELDVAGTVASHARVGRSGELAVPADGNWYDVTETLTGCQAWEVMAGVGARDSDGRYALMHAFAMNAFGANGEITYHQSHFGNKCSRIELRWQRADAARPFEFVLQMRVGCSYGEDIWIKYHMTQLWQDTLMLDSEDKPSRPPHPQYDDKGKVKG
ncbi:hypothetical protein ACL9RI_21835 [Janthinobacterium sp. Mn2066]|uniref:hypothetical protein n=1 Tax=Janthinobacterium sp. Mn2066 TaxID=3395264 RepID=UPI003BDFBF97